MDRAESFLILGLEPTKDERLIKNAYRERLAVTNPEDDPEGFKRLRGAYEAACAYARQSEDGQEERDMTPSGLWVERAEEIYENIRTRQDEDAWRELFRDEIFQSLEEEENCREKLLRFLMESFRLPSAIWKLLDEKLSLVKDAGRLRESFPVDFINYVVGRCEQGEDIDFTLFEGAEDAPYDLFLSRYDSCWQMLRDEKWDEAERLLDEADRLEIRHPAMEVCRGILQFSRAESGDEKERAMEFMKALQTRYPHEIMVSYNTAEMLWKNGDKDDAAKIFLQIKEETEKHYMANMRLADWHYERGEYAEAKKCAENVLSSGAGDGFMETLTKINAELERDLVLRWQRDDDWEAGLELAWCYLQDGKTARGIRLAVALEKRISEEKKAEYTGLLAKLFIEEAEYEDAIRMADEWQKLLEQKILTDEEEEERHKDEDRIRQAHMIRMQCYRCLGYDAGDKNRENFAKAIAEIEAAETGMPKDIGLWLEKAQIYTEMEEYDRSLDITNRLITEYQVYAAAAIAMENFRKQWDARGVIQNAKLCIQAVPGFIRAYEHLAKVYLDLKETEALEQLLEDAGKQGIESPYLEAYRFQMKHTPPGTDVLNLRLEEFKRDVQSKLEEGQATFYELGLPVINKYLYWYPGPYMLRKRAAFHMAGRQFEKALEDYEKALIDEPGNPYIHDSMSRVYALTGDYEQALVSLKKAILYGESEWSVNLYSRVAGLYMQLGDNEQAYVWFRYCEEHNCGENGYLRDMADCLARLGRAEEAAKRLARYYRREDGSFDYRYYRSLAGVYSVAGKEEELRGHMEEWGRRQPKESLLFSPLLPKALRRKNLTEDTADYYSTAAWNALFAGDGKRALELFERRAILGELQNGSDSEDALEDLVFAAILTGEETLGKKYAAKLKKWLVRASYRAVDDYYNRPKSRLMQEFLADYYTASDERLQEILDREKDCANCPFCLMPVCQELEGVRILLLLRQGKREEAQARMERNLEIQPYDEYMKALRPVLG